MGVLSDGKTQIQISFESEDEAFDNQVASHPVQNGQPMTDHVQQQSQIWQMDGKIYGTNQQEIDNKFGTLIGWSQNGVLLSYNGAVHIGSIVIQAMNKTYDEGGFKNAVKLSMTLQEVRVVSTSFVAVTNTGFKQSSPPANPGVWVTVVGGNTYWGWWRQYGTAIQTLRDWNHWPDRFIPIGARARVR
jgi:LysM repeat protein